MDQKQDGSIPELRKKRLSESEQVDIANANADKRLSYSLNDTVYRKENPAHQVQLLDLPVEILAHILSICHAKDVRSASITCKLLHEVASLNSIWKIKSLKEYGIGDFNSNGGKLTHKDIYQNLLFRYGFLLGLWHCHSKPYGGIVKAVFDCEDACIKCYEILPPQSPNIRDRLRKKPLFTISATNFRPPDPHKKVLCCCASPIIHTGFISRSDNVLKYDCELTKVQNQEIMSVTPFSEWLHQEYADWALNLLYQAECNQRRFAAAKKREHYFTAEPFTYLTNDSNNFLIKPGVFVGTYSVHGLEFVHLSVVPGEQIIVRKITGDENVPAREITNTADLTRPMVLTSEQQIVLREIDIPDMEPGVDLRTLHSQPFLVPAHWHAPNLEAPRRCKARFHGKGQIARSGFRNATMTPGHWVLFDEDTFGFLWLELESLSLYSRVREGEL